LSGFLSGFKDTDGREIGLPQERLRRIRAMRCCTGRVP